MKSENYIGINQRIPLSLLEQSLIQFLETGELDKDYIVEQLSVSFKGKNRILKAYAIIKKIFIDNKDLVKLRQHFNHNDFKGLEQGEKNALIISVLSQAYPFSFNLLTNLSSIFKVQETANTKLIYSKMSSYYGSNRSTEIAIYSIIPLFIEMGLIDRIKPGLYSVKNTYDLQNEMVIQFYLLSYFSGTKTKSFLLDDTESHPYFFFFKPHFVYLKKDIKLLTFSANKLNNYIFAI